MVAPDPLTPADCDLRGLPFMPLDVVRVIDSDLFALSTGEEFKSCISLWCKAWLQVPAASLPIDDKILAHLSGSGLRWKKVKKMALRGFILCSDGRYYHPVVAEKALDAWQRREEWQEKQDNRESRQERWRAKVKELSEQLRRLGVTPPMNASLSTLERLLVDAKPSTTPSTPASHVDATETALTGTGTGTGTDKVEEVHPADAGSGKYAFTGDVIRLTEIDLARWRKAYHAIPDIGAELTSLDAWLRGQPEDQQKKWFHISAGSLSKKHQQFVAEAKAAKDGGDLELPIC